MERGVPTVEATADGMAEGAAERVDVSAGVDSAMLNVEENNGTGCRDGADWCQSPLTATRDSLTGLDGVESPIRSQLVYCSSAQMDKSKWKAQ